MKRKSDDPLEKVNINLIKGDFARLQAFAPRKGAGFIIRQIVHSFLESIEARRKPVEVADLDEGEIDETLRRIQE